MYIGKPSIFFKPHPSTFTDETKPFSEIVFGGMNHDFYTANYLTVSNLTDNQIDVCLHNHPYAELMMNMLSQVSDSEED